MRSDPEAHLPRSCTLLCAGREAAVSAASASLTGSEFPGPGVVASGPPPPRGIPHSLETLSPGARLQGLLAPATYMHTTILETTRVGEALS